jgi:Collagen triple helix repeat (20 copies)
MTMFHAIRTRINATTVLAGLALVFAMTGGAYAAKKYLITSTKQISPSVLKSLQGKAGSTGAPGVAGVQGAQGPAGAAGPAGSGGSKGEPGPKGEAGPKGEKGATGSAGATGAKGATGATGVSGFTETLPSGKTETGTWSISDSSSSGDLSTLGSVSFSIPLAQEGAEGRGWAFTQKEVESQEWGKKEANVGEGCKVGSVECVDTGCRGSVAQPTAPAGTLCVYTSFEELKHTNASLEPHSFEGGFDAFGVSGAVLVGPDLDGTAERPASVEASGTWAVTAP